jgi:hypothetical protein
MTVAAGTKLARYEIRSQIGEGEMGEVYLAQDTKLDRKSRIEDSACRGNCESRPHAPLRA